MALAVFYSWDRLGRPITPAQPIREFVEKCKVAFPQADQESLLSWYANESHYQTNYPEDHTPFSVTGWPEPNPPWWVCATDVMHRPDLGVSCDVLVPYWLAEAQAGRMPWLKYLIWQAQLYDVRNNWEPVDNSDHFDHCHLSSRTDHLGTSLGTWSVTPTPAAAIQGDDDMRMVQAADDNGKTYIYDRLDITVNPARPILYEITGDQLFTYETIGIPLKVIGYINWDMYTAGTVTPPPVVVPVEVDASAVAAALIADPTLLSAIAKAVVDEEHARLAS